MMHIDAGAHLTEHWAARITQTIEPTTAWDEWMMKFLSLHDLKKIVIHDYNTMNEEKRSILCEFHTC